MSTWSTSRLRWRGTTSASTFGTSGSGSSRASGSIPTGRVLRHKGKEAVLTNREFELLQFLLDHPHRYYTSSQIMGYAWSDSALFPEEVRNYVSRVRKILARLEIPCDLVNRPVGAIPSRFAIPTSSAYTTVSQGSIGPLDRPVVVWCARRILSVFAVMTALGRVPRTAVRDPTFAL